MSRRRPGPRILTAPAVHLLRMAFDDETVPQARTAGPSPPRAFTQGVGTVFQFVGVLLFLAVMFVCCGSSFLSKDVAERKDWAAIGWGTRTDATDPARPIARPVYSASESMTLCVMGGALLGVSLAGIGLGLQAQSRVAPAAAVLVTGVATIFWVVQCAFAVQILPLAWLVVLLSMLVVLCGGLCVLAVGAWREMRRDPPPAGFGVLPSDYKVPYSHQHADPPEVRLAAELEQRRRRLLVQQKELEALEAHIRRHPAPPDDGHKTR